MFSYLSGIPLSNGHKQCAHFERDCEDWKAEHTPAPQLYHSARPVHSPARPALVWPAEQQQNPARGPLRTETRHAQVKPLHCVKPTTLTANGSSVTSVPSRCSFFIGSYAFGRCLVGTCRQRSSECNDMTCVQACVGNVMTYVNNATTRERFIRQGISRYIQHMGI